MENEGFRELLKEFNPRFDIPSKTYFRNTVLSHMYENVKAKVKFQLTNGVERHSITTDGWTSQSSVDYVTVTVHFINPKFQLLSYVLQTRPLGDQHTADNLAELLKEAKMEWKLTDVFGVTNNAKNITKPFQDILKWPHLGCMGHTLNLSVVKAFSFGSVSKLLAKCKKIVGYFKRSTTAMRSLQEQQQTLNLPQTALISDCETHWNSTYDMLERLLVQEPAVCASIMSSSRRDDRSLSFSDNDISHMRDLVSVLSSFKQVTTRLSAETVSTASLILPTLLKLLNVILQEHDDNNFTKEVKSAIKNDLASRYQDDHVRNFLQISAFIDPGFKHLSFLEASKIEKTIKLIHTECMSVASRRVVPVKHETPVKKKSCQLLLSLILSPYNHLNNLLNSYCQRKLN